MQITVNGKPVPLEDGMNLDHLLAFYRLKKDMVVVELNRAVPPKEAYSGTYLRDGDAVEIVKFLGGG